jgi:RNA polymerase sigma-70 factor (sigma-E family)
MGNPPLVVQDRATMAESGSDDRAQEIAALFSRDYESLHRIAYVFVANAGVAEEIVMDAFVKVFSGWHRFRSVEHKSAYLRQVVINLCRAKLRRQMVERRVDEATHHDPARAVSSESNASDMHLDLWNAIRALPHRQRAAVVLRYLADMSEREIADVLDCSVGTVKSQLSRARLKLGTGMTTEEVSDE